MYIKQVIIQGFKSFRDRTELEPFDPKHNVIIGRNGSGKSNFFSAIQFVLNNEYSYLKQDQRQLLLHEGVGSRVTTAYVEIVFDNTDGRLPLEKNEVYVRRAIGAKKDTYFLNGASVLRAEILNMLETAGFTKSNPYYVVKQGEINQVAIATDSERLKLLREVAGTRVYDERTQESRAILQETEGNLEKSEELLQSIEERIEDLAEEKEELKEYQMWDKERRCLEYTIYSREADENKEKLMELKESYANCVLEQETITGMLKRAQDNIASGTESCRIAEDEVETARQEQQAQSEELQNLIQQAAQLSLTVNDLREEIKSHEESEKSAKAELDDLQCRIDEKAKELETINPEFEKLVKEEEELARKLTLKEQQRKELYAKQGRGVQFHSKEERDEWIRGQLDQLAKQIQLKQAHCAKLKENIANDLERQKTLESNIEIQRREIEEQKRSIEIHEAQYCKEQEEEEQTQSLLKELYREETALQGKLTSEKESLVQAEQNLGFMVGKQILNGQESVRKVLESFRQSPRTSEQMESYCGQIIDSFTCDKGAYTAVEVIAGKRLFHHIVETDKFGTKILKEMNRLRLPGEVTFMPLNRLKVNTPNYPVNDDAFPTITKLVYDDKYDKALRFIFGRTMICRNLEIATKLARESGLDCVTTDGDLVSSRGFLTGGYYNRDRSQLQQYKTRTDLVTKVCDLENQLSNVRNKISTVDQTLNSQISKMQRTEALIRKSKNNLEKMETDLQATKAELNAIQLYRTPNEKNLAKAVSSLDLMYATRAGWEKELSQDLMSQFTASEHELLSTLSDEIRSLTKESRVIFEKRLECEVRKTKLENLLVENLTRRKDELMQMLQQIPIKKLHRQLESSLAQLANVKKEETILANEIEAHKKRVHSFLQMLKGASGELKKWETVGREDEAKLEENAKILDKLVNKKNVLEQKIAEVNEKIAQLGPIPSPETFEKFSAMTNKELFKVLEKTNQRLKRYSCVNKRALDQFVSFSDQREKLVKRKEEIYRAKEKIQELMLTMEQQKCQAITFTFKQVSKYFGEIFKKLSPTGYATLVMRTARGANDGEAQSGLADFDSFVGVGIRVSFSSVESESSEINQLSGGQKSLVALALIFAIQKCNPAPFYLLDELDQALDTNHREAVARMIHELSSEAQFITTTFRPEMLQYADKFYGVTYTNKVSHIRCVTREETVDFVESSSNDDDDEKP